MNARVLLRSVAPSVLVLIALGSIARADPSVVTGALQPPSEQKQLTEAWVKVLPANDWNRRSARFLGRGHMFDWSVPKGATRADGAGGFQLTLKPGTYVLAAGAKHCATAVVDLVVPHSGTLEVPLKYLGVATLTLAVVDGASRPLPKFNLALQVNQGTSMSFQQVRTDATGAATIQIAPGYYEISAQEEPWNLLARGPQKTGRRCSSFTALLKPGGNKATIRLLGKAQRPGVHVTVVDEQGAIVPRTWVALQPDTKGVAAASTWQLLGPDGSPPKTQSGLRDADWNARAHGTDPSGRADFLEESHLRDARARRRFVVVARKGFRVGRSAPIARNRGDVTAVRVVLNERVQRGHVRLVLKTPKGVLGFGAPAWAWATATGESLSHHPLQRRPGALLIPDLPAGKATVWIRASSSSSPLRSTGVGEAYGVGGGAGATPRPPAKRPRSPGLVARIEVTIEAGQLVDRTVQLERAILLEVQLLDATGKPLQGQVGFQRHATGPLARGWRPYQLGKDGYLWVTRTHPADESVIVIERPQPKGGPKGWHKRPKPHRLRVRPSAKGPIVLTLPKP